MELRRRWLVNLREVKCLQPDDRAGGNNKCASLVSGFLALDMLVRGLSINTLSAQREAGVPSLRATLF